MAAPPASETRPTRSAIEQIVGERDDRGSRCCQAIETSKRAFIRVSRQTFLMSPPLVVAFALAGRIDLDITTEPLGTGKDGQDVYLRDIWPTMKEINDLMRAAFDPATYQRLYSNFADQNPLWNEFRQAPATFTSGSRNRLTFASPLTSTTSATRSSRCRTLTARGRSRSSATPSPRTTSVPPARSNLHHRRVVSARERGVDVKTSTATARDAVITK